MSNAYIRAQFQAKISQTKDSLFDILPAWDCYTVGGGADSIAPLGACFPLGSSKRLSLAGRRLCKECDVSEQAVQFMAQTIRPVFPHLGRPTRSVRDRSVWKSINFHRAFHERKDGKEQIHVCYCVSLNHVCADRRRRSNCQEWQIELLPNPIRLGCAVSGIFAHFIRKH